MANRKVAREIWKAIPKHFGYEISNFGRVRSIDRYIKCKKRYKEIRFYRGRILSLKAIGSNGYIHVDLGGHHRSQGGGHVHQLVMEAFIGSCPKGHEVGHRDGNRANNKLTNLRYITRSQNYEDQVRHGTSNHGERCYWAKLSEKSVQKIRKSTDSVTVLAKRYGVSRTTLWYAKVGIRWKRAGADNKAGNIRPLRKCRNRY